MTRFRDPHNNQATINRFAEAYTQHVASGKSLLPDNVQVNAYVDQDVPRPTLSSRKASQLPITEKIQKVFGEEYNDTNAGMTVRNFAGMCYVTEVREGSPAAEAGVMVGDAIYGAHSYDVSSAAEYAAVAFKVPGPLELFIYREGGTNDGHLSLVLYRK